jgi:hypothetical protein
MVMLTNAMCLRVGLPPGSTADQLLGQIRDGNTSLLDGLVAGDQSNQAASESLAERPNYELRLARQNGELQDRYCVVHFESCPLPVLVGLISENDVDGPPTALENLLFWACIDPYLGWDLAWRQGDAGEVQDWRPLVRGRAIIAEPTGFHPAGRHVVSALFGLSQADGPVNLKAPAIASSASTLKVGAPPSSFSATQARLLIEAAHVSHPKWRCLSLYRILENAYLANIKKALLEEFEQDAGKAIESAKKKVSSELNQLVALAESADLTAEFVAFNIEVDALIGAGNQFIIKLDRGAQSERLYKAEQAHKKAVLRFYKLRCAIAHAGTSSVIYEQFADADSAVMSLLPFIEAIALKSLSVAVVE